MDSLVERFLSSGLYARNWSPKTARTYRFAFNNFLKVCPEVPTKSDLERWIVAMRQGGLTPGGCNVYVRTINSYLTWLHSEERTPQRLKLRLLKNPPKQLVTFSDAEVRRLLAHSPKGKVQTRTKALVTLLLDTGLRIDEALGLETRNVDWDGLVLKVVGKGNRERVIPFTPQCRKALWKLTVNTKHRFVVSTRTSLRVTSRNAYRDIREFCAACKVEGPHVHPHSFRHYFAVSYLRSGGDVYRLSRILGHSSINTTSLYLRSTGLDSLREAHAQCSPLARLG